MMRHGLWQNHVNPRRCEHGAECNLAMAFIGLKRSQKYVNQLMAQYQGYCTKNVQAVLLAIHVP